MIYISSDKVTEDLQKMPKRDRPEKFIQSLGTDYIIICLANLTSGYCRVLKNENPAQMPPSIQVGADFEIQSFAARYILNTIGLKDKEKFEYLLLDGGLVKELIQKPVYYTSFEVVHNSQSRYYKFKATRADGWTPDNCLSILGIRIYDDEAKDELELQQQLEDSIAEAKHEKAANKAKTRFLSNMSHDIRTPMNAILGYTRLALSRQSDPEAVNDYLEKIYASGQHLLSLINDVLDVSSIESGRLQLNCQPHQLGELFAQICEIIRNEVRERGQRFIVDLADVQNETVLCDGLRLKQICINLLSNATKYTDSGGEVMFEVYKILGDLPDVQSYEITVTDTGIGMSPAFIATIFDQYTREQTNKTEKVEGTGLGMAITKSLVEIMNGSIEIQSRPGIGTRVRIVLPFTKLTSDAAQISQNLIETSGSHIRRGRLLIVDDNAFNREITQAMMEDAGFAVNLATNGQEAVDQVWEHEAGYYQAVLMDVQMPVMNGLQAAEAIRKLPDPGKSVVPIIALTADAFEEDKQRVLAHGMDGYVPKPLEPEVLIKEILRVQDLTPKNCS